MNISYNFSQLKDYIESENYLGWDPYDGLNSKLFNSISYINKNKIIKLIWIQLFKRLPINIRPLVGIEKEYNPKALGLFLSAYSNLYNINQEEKYKKNILFLIDKIIKIQSNGWSGSCWGYNFDWQARAFFQPKYTPTIVASSFVASSLLDAYDILKEDYLLEVAKSTSNFILKDLNRSYDNKGNFAFSYSPLDNTEVYNASLLGARLLARLYHYTKDEMLKNEAKKTVEFCVNAQKRDGSWTYGTLPFHQWIDSFHTGYNLECIYDYMQFLEDYTYIENFKKGLKYYVSNFFTDTGIPKYYNNKIYPIDIHAPAQLIITLHKTKRNLHYQELLNNVLKWTIKNMQNKNGYFYYQKRKFLNSKIPYIRWAQAWMFLSLSYLLSDKAQKE